MIRRAACTASVSIMSSSIATAPRRAGRRWIPTLALVLLAIGAFDLPADAQPSNRRPVAAAAAGPARPALQARVVAPPASPRRPNDVPNDRSARPATRALAFPINHSIGAGGAARPSRELSSAERQSCRDYAAATRARLRQVGIPERMIESAVDHLGLGWPSAASKGNPNDFLIAREEYVLSYNRDRKAMNWAAWKLTAADAGRGRKRYFETDPLVPGGWDPAVTEDYKGSGYTRGHVVAAGEKGNATFFLSNILPQTYDSNAGAWHTFETYYRDLAFNQGKDVYVMAGPVWGDGKERIGHGAGIEVPDALWKVIVVVERGQSMAELGRGSQVIAVVVPNDERARIEDTFEKFRVAPDTIRGLTGLAVLDGVPGSMRGELMSKLDRSTVEMHRLPHWKQGQMRDRGMAPPTNSMFMPRPGASVRPTPGSVVLPRPFFRRSTGGAQPTAN
jgi:endonuclease G